MNDIEANRASIVRRKGERTRIKIALEHPPQRIVLGRPARLSPQAIYRLTERDAVLELEIQQMEAWEASKLIADNPRDEKGRAQRTKPVAQTKRAARAMPDESAVLIKLEDFKKYPTLSRSDVQAVTHRSASTVHRLADEGKIDKLVTGRYKTESVKRYLDSAGSD